MFLVLLVLEFGSMLVLYFEQNAPGANITTGGDALWWAFVSITTVGYGDKFPITAGGRVSAFFVLAAGVGLFGVLSGYLANFFLTPSSADEEEPRRLPRKMATPPRPPRYRPPFRRLSSLPWQIARDSANPGPVGRLDRGASEAADRSAGFIGPHAHSGRTARLARAGTDLPSRDASGLGFRA